MEERSILGDERLASMQGRRKLTQPTFLCPSKNKVAFLCRNPKCDAALHCSYEDCLPCFSKHENCGKIYNISYLTKKLNNLTETRKEVIGAVDEIDREFHKQIERGFDQFTAQYPNYSLDEKTSGLVEKIYRQEKGTNMSGVQADQLCAEVDDKFKEHQSLMNGQLKLYKQRMTELSQQAKQLKIQLRQSLTESKYHHGFKSVILKYPNDDQKIEYLLKSLSEIRPIESLKLLFRATRDGFAASTFHQKCDNTDDTVVILRTQFGKTIAGYSHYRWNSANVWLNDAGKHTFLLQLDSKEKYVPQSQNKLICCMSNFGPTFGGGCDLYVSDNCNINNSGAQFPTTYNMEGPNKIQLNQQSYTNFSGAMIRSDFKVVDYEVFRVYFS